ncbi:MAG: PIN domain-containing protein [Nitrosomonas sp.]|uniref:type II toxin-antitoxin system VapC family toxin n=1 Tax=Nitrosomonas sp. TaxID=42353 RepID=UPI001DC2A587|nr:PIN domain-containing protein [Nitrosomonas sp.]MBX9894918.1 PIN domain-containing protein [Nitrosomonas sp.]
MAAKGADGALFIDTNTLVYANVLEAPLHKNALTAITTAFQDGRELWISRQVIREYLATLTRPQTFGAVPKQTVLAQINQFLEQFNVADDSLGVTEKLLNLMTHYEISGKKVHDANIVATMLAYSIPAILTHNTKDFERFSDIVTVEAID